MLSLFLTMHFNLAAEPPEVEYYTRLKDAQLFSLKGNKLGNVSMSKVILSLQSASLFSREVKILSLLLLKFTLITRLSDAKELKFENRVIF